MDKLEYALQILLLGFSVVLFTLFLLYGVFSAFKHIFYHPEEKNLSALPVNPSVKINAGLKDSGLPSRVLAAITTAVTCYLQGRSPGSYAISVQARPNRCTGRWTTAGRKTLLEGRLELEQLRRKGLT